MDLVTPDDAKATGFGLIEANLAHPQLHLVLDRDCPRSYLRCGLVLIFREFHQSDVYGTGEQLDSEESASRRKGQIGII